VRLLIWRGWPVVRLLGKRVPRLGGHVAVAAAVGGVSIAPKSRSLVSVVASAGANSRLLPAVNPPYPTAAMTARFAAGIRLSATDGLACLLPSLEFDGQTTWSACILAMASGPYPSSARTSSV
jgi:hypothetical protein